MGGGGPLSKVNSISSTGGRELLVFIAFYVRVYRAPNCLYILTEKPRVGGAYSNIGYLLLNSK